MIAVVVVHWIRLGLVLAGVDFSNGIVGLEITMLVLGCFLVAVSHILVFVCDSLTGGDAGPSAWALAIFWGGVVVLPLLFSGFVGFL